MLYFIVLYPRIDETDLLEVLWIMTDYVVDVGVDQLGGEDVALGGHMTVEVEALAEFGSVVGAVFVKVDDVGIVEDPGQLVEKIDHLRRGFLAFGAVGAREGDEEEFCLGADLLVTADDSAVEAREGLCVVVMPIRSVDIVDRADGHVLVVDIVDSEGDDISLSRQLGVPEAAGLGEGLDILLASHAALGEIVGLEAVLSRDVLSPRVFVEVVVMCLARLVAGLELARGKAVANEGDGSENACAAVALDKTVKRLFVFGVEVFIPIHFISPYCGLIRPFSIHFSFLSSRMTIQQFEHTKLVVLIFVEKTIESAIRSNPA